MSQPAAPQISRPSLATVARAQLNLATTYLRTRRSLIAALVTIVLVALFSFFDGFPVIKISNVGSTNEALPQEVSLTTVGDELDLTRGVVGLCTVFLIACLYGFTSSFRVWRDASLRQRGHHWTLPVPRHTHDLIRVAAGAVPLVAMLLTLTVAALLGLLLGGHAGALQIAPPSVWLGILLTPLLLYLVSTVAVLRSDRPAVPILIAIGSFYFLFVMTLLPGSGLLNRIADHIVTGPYSLTVAVAGPLFQLIERGLVDGSEFRVDQLILAGDTWPAAVALWLAIALAVVFAATTIRPRQS